MSDECRCGYDQRQRTHLAALAELVTMLAREVNRPDVATKADTLMQLIYEGAR